MILRRCSVTRNNSKGSCNGVEFLPPSSFRYRRRKPVGVSKVPSTFVRQFDRSGTLSAGRQAPCAQTSRLRSLSLFGLSVAGLPVSLQRFVPLTTSSLRGSRSLFELSAFLPCSLVTAPRVAFVGGLLMPSARSALPRSGVVRWGERSH